MPTTTYIFENYGKKKSFFCVSSDLCFLFHRKSIRKFSPNAGSFYYGFHKQMDIFSESVTVYNIKIE